MAIGIDRLSGVVSSELVRINENIKAAIEASARETMAAGKDKIAALGDYNDLTGKYRKSFTCKITRTPFGHEAVLYAKGHQSSLTHLLEDGHATRNGGRTRAYPHWKPTEDFMVARYERAINEILANL